MNRFHKERKKHSLAGRLFVPLLSFAAVMLFLWAGIRDASDAASAEQEKSLKNAIQRSVVHCYAVEGSYPPLSLIHIYMTPGKYRQKNGKQIPAEH